MDASDLSYSGRLPTIKPLGRLLLQCSTLSAETNLVLSTVPNPDVDERPRFSFPPSLSTVIGLSDTHLSWLGSNEHNLPNRKNFTLLDPPQRIVRTPRMSSSPLGPSNTGDSSWDDVVEGKIKSWIREELPPNLDDVLSMAEPRNGQRQGGLPKESSPSDEL